MIEPRVRIEPVAASPSGADKMSVPAGLNGPQPAVRVIAVTITLAVLVFHVRETVVGFPLGFNENRPLPFTQHDHPFHYYYSQLTADFFARRGAFWGYDPNFMAGYAKTLIFPTGCTLSELVAVVFGKDSVRAYRVFVAACAFLPPVFLGFAARVLAGRWSAAMLAFGLSVVWVWCGWPWAYVRWGMGPFVLSITASVLTGSLLASWLDEPKPRTLVAGGVLAALATIAHPCSPVILVLMLWPAYVAQARELGWRRHVAAWAVPAIALLLWSPWWVPAWRLRDTFGSTETGFVNVNIGGRLIELATAGVQFREESALLVAGVAAAVSFWGIGRARFCALVLGAAQLFVLTYFGSAIAWIWKLQPGRYTQPLYAALVVIVAVGWIRLMHRLHEQPWRRRDWAALILTSICSLAGVVLVAPKLVGYLSYGSRPRLDAKLPPQIRDLVAFLRTRADASGRVLFEDHGDLDLGFIDPFSGANPSALLPLLAPAQYVGGPYLKTHLKTNFTQVGDGNFFGRDLAKQSVDRTTFEQYAELYNIRWVVLRSSPVTEQELIGRGAPKDLATYWSAPLWRLAEANPELFHPRATFGYIRVYELSRKPNWAVIGRADVAAAPDVLTVSAAEPDADGRLVLSYHWISTLRSTVPLRPVFLADDPAPFIEVINPPPQFVIENAAW
jgi:hypothetical protein